MSGLSRHRRIIALGLATALLSVPSPAQADHDGPVGCTDASRECVIEAADKYLAALISHDTSDVPLAHDAWWQGNGGSRREGADAIREALEPPVTGDIINTGIRQLRWYVDGEHATAFFLLDTLVLPVPLIERFRVIDGLIHEIEAIFWVDPPGYAAGPDSITENGLEAVEERFFRSNHGPLGPAPGIGPLASVATPETDRGAGDCPSCGGEAAQAYLDAVVSGDASEVPLAPDAVRRENRRTTGEGAEEIRAALEAPEMDSVTGMRDVRLYVDADEVVAYFVIETTSGDVWSAGRFRVTDGLITEIEILCAQSERCR